MQIFDAKPSRLRFLADLHPDGMIAVDVHGESGIVTLINHQAARLLDVDLDAANGLAVEDVVRLQDQDGRTWWEVNRPDRSISIRVGVPEQSWLNARGEEVLTTARLVRDDRFGPVEAVAIGIRSGRGRARLDRERSDLVATVAHELRSPLTGVKGFVQALLNRWDKLNDDQRKLMLNTVNADADRLARLIAELLDVARIDTDRLSLYPRECDAALLTRRCVDSVRAGTSRDVGLLTDADGPMEIFADPDKFSQVVTNLIENGVRHGGGAVRVALAEHSGGGPSADWPHEWPGVRIVVDDEGEGIPEEMRRRVFTKFWRHGASGGTGLGMYIVNGLTRAHGGAVGILEAPGGGARVVIDWPAEDRRD